jgi:predicted nucleic acid-binding protein
MDPRCAQVTDAHLLALAIARGGRLVTFDRRIGRLVSDARSDVLEVIPV